MKFKELIEYLDSIYPKSLSAPWDKDGVEVCLDYNTEVERVLIALDITCGVINYAAEHGYNCIISHHPMIFSPLNKFDEKSGINAKKAVLAARNNICAASFHTRLDAVAGGVNDCLLNALGITNERYNIENLFDSEYKLPLGRIFTFESGEEKTLPEFAKHVNTALNTSAGYIGGKSVKKVAVVSGSGMNFINEAFESGADTFLTGEGKYGDILEINETYGMNIVAAGHFETEIPVLPAVKCAVTKEFDSVRADCFNGDCTWKRIK
jgi:dinuclear metal center YbgI/SA1388 family protein